MASDEFGEKTHEATPYRRQKAREEGQVVKSQDLTSAALLVIALLVLWYGGSSLIRYFGDSTREQLGSQPLMSLTREDVCNLALRTGRDLSLVVLPVLGLLMLGAVVVHMGQSGFLYLPDKLGFDINRINPLQNAQRIFSLSSVVHLAMGMFKVAIVSGVAAYCVWQERDRLLLLPDQSVAEIGSYLFSTVLWTSLKIGGALLVLALIDYGYQFWKNEQDLRMTTQEMREEIKQQQGDPQIASRRKQMHRQLVMRTLSTTVPKADVVVTNPTELAIALKYDPETMPAPIVVAKGAGALAQRIRRLALENNIPIVERKELARVLYKMVEINQQVPAEQYAAVAEVVRYVYQLKGKKLPGSQAA
jgi:flagellar biosynthesis protein FlhB